MTSPDTPAAPAASPLLPAALQSKLKALELLLRRPLPSNLRGDHRAPNRKGISLEFADFRGYVPGDDVRHLDWSSYARLDQLIVRLYHDEEDVQLHLVVDDSPSMRFGGPAVSKGLFARRVAAALAWIGLTHQQRVSVTLLSDKIDGAPLASGAAALPRLLEALAEMPAPPSPTAPIAPDAARGSLVDALRAFVALRRPRGAVVLISDLLDRAGPGDLLRPLESPVTEVTLVQVLAPDEIDPGREGWEGDLRLLDSETGQHVEVNLSAAVLEAYAERARRFVAHCAETARRRGANFAFSSSAVPVEEFLLRSLVRERVLR